MRESEPPLVMLNIVGLTSRLLPLAPRLYALAQQGWTRPLREVLPAVTCTAQASILTGASPQQHGIVANGWLYRDTREIRFWQQSNALIEVEPIYQTLRRQRQLQGRPFTCAKLFWWFNQGADVDWSLTPKPYYGCDGNKIFDVTGTPEDLAQRVKQKLGSFPFHTFWGPKAGRGCTQWIARSAAYVLNEHRPNLTLVYLPHLDYDPQRWGPSNADMARCMKELDEACSELFDATRQAGAAVWVVSEYGHVDVDNPLYLNRILRRHGLLDVRDGPFGETLDTFSSRALAVCDHQCAHIYVRCPEDQAKVRAIVEAEPGIARTFLGEERAEIGLHHPRAGEIVALAEPRSWFAYPYWLDNARAPDFAPTVDIHRKPGFDPCEMFFDPKLKIPTATVVRKLIAKKLGFRIKMDVIPLDASIVRGSHGLSAESEMDRPILIGDGPPPPMSMAVGDVYRLLYDRFT